jgi:hypothetical protein
VVHKRYFWALLAQAIKKNENFMWPFYFDIAEVKKYMSYLILYLKDVRSNGVGA